MHVLRLLHPTRSTLRGAAACACLVFFTAACQVAKASLLETYARIVGATIVVRAGACGDLILAADDSLPFDADVLHTYPSSGFSRPAELLYTARGAPHAVRWTVGYPPPSTPTVRYPPRGEAEITPQGVLIGRAPGYVFAVVSSAGKSERREVHIVSRITRFAVRPADTTVHVGDSLTLHADLEVEGQPSQMYLRWEVPRGDRRQARQLDVVEQDPDDKAPADRRDLRVVAIAPGVVPVRVCAAGGRQDTVTVRVVGEALPRSANGVVARGSPDAPPALRLRPMDTTVHAGESFRTYLRILNANLGNGPWHWRVAFGDGEKSEGTGGPLVTSAFGFALDIPQHWYRSAGAFALTATVADSAGRSTTVRTSITAVAAHAEIEVLPGVSPKVIRLSDPRPDIPIAILSAPGDHARPSDIFWLASSAEMKARRAAGLPMLRFGRTEYEWNPDAGFGGELRDVNGDGEPDLVLHVDKAALIRNGDLHVGHNRLVVTGAALRPYGAEGPRPFTPLRGVAVFEVIL